MADTIRFPFTQRDAYTALRSLVETGDLGIEDEELAEVLTSEALVEFLDHRLAQLAKAKPSGAKKPTPRQAENLAYEATIYNWMEPDTAYQSGEIAKGVPELVESGMKPQRVVHILTAMVKNGLVTRVEDKRKAYYTRVEGADLPVADNEAEEGAEE